jgi:hypothetical protein
MKAKYNYTLWATCRVFNIRAGETYSNYYNFKGNRPSSVGIKTGYGLNDPGSISGRGKKLFLYSTASRPVLGLNQPPI